MTVSTTSKREDALSLGGRSIHFLYPSFALAASVNGSNISVHENPSKINPRASIAEQILRRTASGDLLSITVVVEGISRRFRLRALMSA